MTPPAATTHPSATPILDRQAPLPPRSAPGSGLAGVLTVWFGVLTLVVTNLLLFRPPFLHQWVMIDLRQWLEARWIDTGIVGIAISALAAYYAMIAVHEMGHVLVGLCVGFRLRSYRVGPMLFTAPTWVTLYRGPGALTNGVADLSPTGTNRLAGRGVAMVLGGPAANLLTGMGVLYLPFPLTVFAACFLVFSVTNGLMDLLPYESRLGVSDGRRIGMLLRQRAHGERWLALLHLGGALHDGVSPDDLAADFLARAVAVRDPSADTVLGHGLAYAAAFHQHRDEEAGHLLETCLTYASHAMPVVREGLMSDAAVFQARRRKRADLAEQWLADLPAQTSTRWFRTRAEAALLEANGDAAGAMAKLAEVETTVRAFPESARRETLLGLLQRWKDELLPEKGARPIEQ